MCKREGGNLAIIFNDVTRDAVRNFMKDGWIGVTDQNKEGKWVDPLGGDVRYTSWNGGEPNNSGGNEDCTMQHENKRWNDLNCDSEQPFICQFKLGSYKRPDIKSFAVPCNMYTVDIRVKTPTKDISSQTNMALYNETL